MVRKNHLYLPLLDPPLKRRDCVAARPFKKDADPPRFKPDDGSGEVSSTNPAGASKGGVRHGPRRHGTGGADTSGVKTLKR